MRIAVKELLRVIHAAAAWFLGYRLDAAEPRRKKQDA